MPDDGRADSHYPTMTTKAIRELFVDGRHVEEIAHENAVLFLWSTNSHVPDSLSVIRSWGFEYKTNMAWVKERATKSLGFYLRGKHELLLISTRGSFLPSESVIRPESVIAGGQAEHSKKPDAAYDLVEQLYPGIARLELFARSTREGWGAWPEVNGGEA